MNIGLMAMILLSLLPVGLMQTWASVEHGYWYARSAEFLQTDLMSRLRWMRMFGDTIFAVGAITDPTCPVLVPRRRPRGDHGLPRHDEPSRDDSSLIVQRHKRRVFSPPRAPSPHQIDRIIVSSILNRLGAATACG